MMYILGWCFDVVVDLLLVDVGLWLIVGSFGWFVVLVCIFVVLLVLVVIIFVV